MNFTEVSGNVMSTVGEKVDNTGSLTPTVSWFRNGGQQCSLPASLLCL